MDSREHAEILDGLRRVEESKGVAVLDPNGDNPPCMNAVGFWLCEWCGQDVRNRRQGACPAIPTEQRWRFGEPNDTQPALPAGSDER